MFRMANLPWRKSDQADHSESEEEENENGMWSIEVPSPKKIKDKEQLASIRKHIERLSKFVRKKEGFKGYRFGEEPNSIEIAVVLILNDLWRLAREKKNLEESTEPFISQRVAAFRYENEREVQRRDSKIAELEKEVRWLKSQNNDHQSRVDQIKSEHWAEIERERRIFHEKETKLKVQNDSALGAKDQRHREHVIQLKQEFQAIKESFEFEIKGERRRIENEREEFELEKRGIKLEGEEEKKRLKQEQARQKKQLLEQQAKMAKENEALNKSLLTRDRFKPITDLELKTLFTDLESDVTHLATLKWSSSQTEWPDDLLSNLSDNQRKLKKQLSQDMIWLILYERIFCTPFKVFGEEGRALGEKWNDAFGKDPEHSSMYYSWPKPAIDAERWRYQTIKGCKEAVEQSISDYDDRSKLKKEFNKNLESITQDLIDALGKVSQLDQNQMKSLEEIPKKAAKTWIEMGTQRCRILVVLPGSSVNSQVGRLKRAREGGLDLVIVPELRRLGNSAGQDLDSDNTTICEATTIKVLAG